jgi:hypothetical protein
MTRDDIIRMAREAGWKSSAQDIYPPLERFAALVAAAEREACARLLDDNWFRTQSECAAAIQARGEEPMRHPGYIVGDHWLQAAYTRVCTGETEDEVMTDYGWQRESR